MPAIGVPWKLAKPPPGWPHLWLERLSWNSRPGSAWRDWACWVWFGWRHSLPAAPAAIWVRLFEETRELIPSTKVPRGNNPGADIVSWLSCQGSPKPRHTLLCGGPSWTLQRAWRMRDVNCKALHLLTCSLQGVDNLTPHKGCDSQGGHGVAAVLELRGASQEETAWEPKWQPEDLQGQAQGTHRKYKEARNHGNQRWGRFGTAEERQTL